jgi:hypothetical protein
MTVWKPMTSAALVAIVIGVAVPAAAAAAPDAVARFVAYHQAPDAIGRWLATDPVGVSLAAAPVSDVESSLYVERRAVTRQPAQLSDVASSLQVARVTAAAAQPAPVSDVASSLHVQSAAAAVSLAPTRNRGGFAWQDAGIGAGATLLLVSIALSSLTLVRRHRHVIA